MCGYCNDFGGVLTKFLHTAPALCGVLLMLNSCKVGFSCVSNRENLL
ncbi:hypothetical protein NEIPOLOT_01980 [Neisseria polysaccharea ATCC 43768]|nr:hypothetical protein NEIPOLOT_01980 [Neisseria polysaccharea ATCC 43768]